MFMADEQPIKLVQIGPKGGAKKDGFNLVTERVIAVNPVLKQIEVELLAYDGKTVVLDVAEEVAEELQNIKPGDGATIRVVEEGADRKPVTRARKELQESISSSVDIFSAKRYFLSDEFSLVDCSIAPILWRLPAFSVELPTQARPILRYMDEVFSRPSFQASLTELEQEMRQ